MKSFEDFVKSTEADHKNLVDDLINELKSSGNRGKITSEELAAFLMTSCMRYTNQSLRMYHEWLSGQVEK